MRPGLPAEPPEPHCAPFTYEGPPPSSLHLPSLPYPWPSHLPRHLPAAFCLSQVSA